MRARALCAALALALAGCAQMPPPVAAPPSDLERVVEQRRAQALRLENAGDLHGAVEQWQIVVLLAPGDPGAAAALSRVEHRRQHLLADALAAAAAARRRGDGDAAAKWLLHALALEPEHEAAADQLRQIERQRMARIQAARVARQRSEPAPAEPPRLPAPTPAKPPPRPDDY